MGVPIISAERGFEIIKESIEQDWVPSRERSLALTKLEECEMWLAKCKPVGTSDGNSTLHSS